MNLASRNLAGLSAVLVALATTACGGESSPDSRGGTGGAGGDARTSTETASASGGAGGSASSSASTSAGGAGGAGGDGGTGGAGSGGGGAGGASTTSTSTSSSNTGGAGGSSTSSSSSSSTGTLTGTTVIRIAAANLTSGNNQSYDPGHGIHILQGVAADIILMQEMNYGGNSAASLRELADKVCGVECAFTRGSGDIPNGVVSRYPILAKGAWKDPRVGNRDFAWARIDVPGAADLWGVSVHLLTKNATERDLEAAALVELLTQNVPSSDYIVVGGDFNTATRTEDAITTFAALLSTFAPYPADPLGNDNTNAGRTKPYDWVLPSPSLRTREIPLKLSSSSFVSGLVVDTRVYTPIEDLAPAIATDSGAPSMQHMLVARDFLFD
jgi:endonuclease/exonuclease/phosphatase family metal-dependent hydrolase